MIKIGTVMLMATLFFCGKAFAMGVDLSPIHVYTGLEVMVPVRVHVKGDTCELKIVVDSILRDEDSKSIRMIVAHRKGDADEKFEIKVTMADLDDDSRDLIGARLKTEVVYKTRMLRLDDNWKLLAIRKNDDD